MQPVAAIRLVVSICLAVGAGRGGRTRRTRTSNKTDGQRLTWFVDGDNLWGSRGVSKDREVMRDKLRQVRNADGVYLVFDGKGRGLTENVVDATSDPPLRIISLAEGTTADDYIYDEIKSLLHPTSTTSATKQASSSSGARVQVVTADRKLRRRVLGIKPRIVRNVINPVTFWRRYLPRLTGSKLPATERLVDEEVVPEDAE